MATQVAAQTIFSISRWFPGMLKKSGLSLRYRMTLGLAMLIVPMFILVGLIYVLFSQTVSSFDEVAAELLHELVPVSEMQRAVLNVSYSVDDFVLHAGPLSRERFMRASKQVKMLCNKLKSKGFTDRTEKQILASVELAWRQVSRTGLDLLDGKISDDQKLYQLRRFHQQINTMLLQLDRVYAIIQTEIEVEHASVKANESKIYLLVFTIVVATLLISILVGMWLIRLVTQPLALLGKGADRLAAGELSHRIDLPDSRNEFHKLADTLNNMSREIESLVMQDGLTRLLNRRAFDDRLNDEYNRSKRYNQPLSLLMLDIDHFKQVNDTYGHPAGDEILRLMAALMLDSVREIDAVARYGGEELAVILPTTDLIHARALAERIRRSVASYEFKVAGKILHITVSIGLAVMPDHALTVVQLIDAADQSLYAAKHQGRNRVCSYNGTSV